MRRLVFLALLLLAGYVAYHYYFGHGEDQVRAETIVQETRDLTRAVGDMLKRQKEKYDAGEFDRTIDRVGNSLEKLRSQPRTGEGKDAMRELENELRQIDTTRLTPAQRTTLQRVFRQIEEGG